MGALTEVLKLYMPGGGSLGLGGADEVLDVDKLNQNSQKIDEFAKGWGKPSDRNQAFYGLAANRTSIVGVKRGDTYQESDGKQKLWTYTGTSWISRGEGGMYAIVPDSANLLNATVDLQGVVTLNVPTSQWAEIRNVFTADFRNYLIEYYLSDNGVGLPQLRMMNGTTTQVVANSYTNSGFSVSTGAAISPYYNTNNYSQLAQLAGSIAGGSIRIYEPRSSSRPTIIETSNNTGALLNQGSSLHSGSGAVVSDGFSIARMSSACAGTLRIYGLI